LQIDEWFDRQFDKRRHQIEWLTRSLTAYHAGVFARSQQASISLPYGSLGSRAQQPEWSYPDEQAFMAWAREHAPSLVRTPPQPADEIDRAEAKRLLTRRDAKDKPIEFGVTADGERPPGLLVISRDRKYAIELTEGEQ
jgi:hypothetical protein